jgi:predicted RNA binding protein YcfA (HicA-like mRNA interferase family)
MPRRPRYLEIAKVLIKYYGYVPRSRKGSHVWLGDNLGHRVTVLATNEEANRHNFTSILRQTGLSKEDIEKYL